MRAVVVSNDVFRGRCPWWRVCGVVRQHGDGLDIDRVGEEFDDPPACRGFPSRVSPERAGQCEKGLWSLCSAARRDFSSCAVITKFALLWLLVGGWVDERHVILFKCALEAELCTACCAEKNVCG